VPLGETDESLGLAARSVAKRFYSKGGDVLALENVMLSARKGNFVSLIGPTGCGKSTMLRIFADLIPPTSGEVRINGKEVGLARKDRDFSVVFQSPNLLPWRNVLKNVCLPLEVMGEGRKERKARAKRILEVVGLSSFERHQPWQLSGGMQQKVALARALVMNPSVLLMDEPFGALDEITRDRMNLELMSIWQKFETTVLFITHSIPEAVFLSSHVVVMSARPGRTVAALSIDLPYPRTQETRSDPRFFEFVNTLRKHLAVASQQEGS